LDIKWRKYSHSVFAKITVFIIAILCFTGAMTIFVDMVGLNGGDLGIVFEDSYYLGKEYIRDSSAVVESVGVIVERYKSEEHILQGGSLTEDEVKTVERELFTDFEYNSKSYNPNLASEENYKTFLEVYAGKISEAKNDLIKQELQAYKAALRRLAEYQGVFYYAKKGAAEFTNSPDSAKGYFQTFPSYMVFDGSEQRVFPEEIKENIHYYWMPQSINQLGQQDMIYIAFTEEFLNPRIESWKNNKTLVTYGLKQIAGFLAGLAAALIYLVLVIGRKPDEEQEVHLNLIDRLYNDFNLLLCFSLIALWAGVISTLHRYNFFKPVFSITLVISACGLILILSLVKHLKNRTLISHSLLYTIFYRLFKFGKEVYDSGSVGVKVVVIVIGYPILAAITFFMFPITLGAAAWLALKKVKEFNAIKEGVQKVKEGDIHHTIAVSGNGEFGRLAADINSITDGLNKAVDNELKSERLKTELITNVSHDIRTPLTSIITYVDLLKNEQNQIKSSEYLEIIDQKSQRLKILTEDLFEAAKATSGTIPVNYEKIDIVSLITQGLGELNDKIEEMNLEIKLNHPKDKVYIKADGKLFWRAIENLFSNILKYALEGSRVYLDIIDSETMVTLIIKNISAYELNISSDELMERFKRGDESRSSQGSGLGLSIAKSLIEIQRGRFHIEIDGDLFKAVIQMAREN